MAPTTKVFKTGRVVVILTGRFAGKKGVVLSTFDQGSRNRAFGHALVVGIEKAPRRVTKRMTAAQIDKRCNVKAFIKHVNYSHMMPTRYVVSNEIDVKSLIADRKIENAADKRELKHVIGKTLKEKFLNPEDPKCRDLIFLRKKLRF